MHDGTCKLNPAWPSNSQGSPGSKHMPLVYISAQNQALVPFYQKENEKNTTIHTLKQKKKEQDFTYVFYIMIKYFLWYVSWIICTCYICYIWCYHDIYMSWYKHKYKIWKCANEKKNCQDFVQCHRHTAFSSKNSRRGYGEEAPLKGSLFKKSISSKQTNKPLNQQNFCCISIHAYILGTLHYFITERAREGNKPKPVLSVTHVPCWDGSAMINSVATAHA